MCDIKIVAKEDMLGESERWFTSMIRFTEKNSINDEERLALFSTFNRGIKSAINLFYDTKGRIEYLDHLSIYVLGVKETTFKINDMVKDMLQLIEKRNIDAEEKIKILFVQAYTNGINLATDLYSRNKLNEDVIKVIEDFDTILSEYKGENPEEIWEKIRNRIGVSIDF